MGEVVRRRGQLPLNIQCKEEYEVHVGAEDKTTSSSSSPLTSEYQTND